MGIPVAVAEFLFAEHSYKPIVGDVGFIGRQTTYLTELAFRILAQRYNVAPPPGFTIEQDVETMAVQNVENKFVTDRTMIRLFGGKYLSIDVSDYEGADVVTDLSLPVPEEHHKKFDFIYDGSCLDNIFNPAQALMNMSKMLRPGGRIVLANHGSHFNGAYSVFSPGWFFDFFAANKYKDCKVYLSTFQDHQHLCVGDLPLYYYNWKQHPLGAAPSDKENLLIMVVAEKGRNSTDDFQPIQFHYRDAKYEKNTFAKNVQTIFKSKRPIINLGTQFDQPASYQFCGMLGKDMRF